MKWGTRSKTQFSTIIWSVVVWIGVGGPFVLATPLRIFQEAGERAGVTDKMTINHSFLQSCRTPDAVPHRSDSGPFLLPSMAPSQLHHREHGTGRENDLKLPRVSQDINKSFYWIFMVLIVLWMMLYSRMLSEDITATIDELHVVFSGFIAEVYVYKVMF